MKKGFVLIIALILGLLCLLSCASTTDNSSGVTQNTTPIATTPGNSNNDSSHTFASERTAQFQALTEDNPIDLAYASEQYPSTTQEMTALEQKYAGIWLEELDYSCSSLADMLDDEEKAEFLRIQRQWQENFDDSTKLLHTLAGKNAYQKFGTVFRLESAIYFREQIRERTLHIKYLQFCLSETVDFKTGDGTVS